MTVMPCRSEKSKVAAITVYKNIHLNFRRLDALGSKARKHGLICVGVGYNTYALSVVLIRPKIEKTVGVNKTGILDKCGDQI